MTTIEIAKEGKTINRDEATYVDAQYEYLLEHKKEGIALEEYAKKRDIDI